MLLVRQFINIIVMLMTMVVLVACNNDTESTEDSENDISEDSVSEEQEVVYGTPDDPIGLSPIETWDSVSDIPIEQMYDRLFVRNHETGEFEPSLVESYENTDDETWIFELKEGIEFHDGNPLNAEAVVYTFEELVNPDNANPGAHVLEFMENIEATDEYTVELTTDGPHSNVLPALANRTSSIISPEADQNQDLMSEPVGSGPFIFESWEQGDRLEMTSNENYWDGAPELDHITFLTVPDDSTALSMLETGEVDIVADVASEQIERVESIQNVNLTQIEGSPGYWLSFNMEEEPMNELEFRQAVNMGIDVGSYVSQYENVIFESNSLFGPSVPDYEESIEEAGYEYDPETAQELVEENSYDEYEINLYTSNRATHSRMAEIAEAQLSDIGLNINIELMDWETMLDVTANGDHDMYALSGTNTGNGLETLESYFHSNYVGANNRAQYANDEYDALVEEAMTTIDEEERQEIVNEAHQHIINESIIVPMHHEIATIAHNDSIQDIYIYAEEIISLKDAYIE